MQCTASFLFLSLISLVVGSVHPNDVQPDKAYTLNLNDQFVLGSHNGKIYREFVGLDKFNVSKDKIFKFPYGIPKGPNTVLNGGFLHIMGGRNEKQSGGLLYSTGKEVFDNGRLDKPQEDAIRKIIAVPFEDGVKLRWAGQSEYWYDDGAKFTLFPYSPKFMINEVSNAT